jgi:hypothetical protein
MAGEEVRPWLPIEVQLSQLGLTLTRQLTIAEPLWLGCC